MIKATDDNQHNDWLATGSRFYQVKITLHVRTIVLFIFFILHR